MKWCWAVCARLATIGALTYTASQHKTYRKFTVSQSFSIAIKFKCQMTPSTQWLPMCAPVYLNGKEVNGSVLFFVPLKWLYCVFLALTAVSVLVTHMHEVDIAREFSTADLQPDKVRKWCARWWCHKSFSICSWEFCHKKLSRWILLHLWCPKSNRQITYHIYRKFVPHIWTK